MTTPTHIYIDTLAGKYINWLSDDWETLSLDEQENVLCKTPSIIKLLSEGDTRVGQLENLLRARKLKY